MRYSYLLAQLTSSACSNTCVGNADGGIFFNYNFFVYCINLVHGDNVDAALREWR